MIRVETGSRLHFGLYSLPGADTWPNHAGEPRVPARRFGGVGLMVEQPGVAVTVRPAVSWSAEGPLAERALGLVRHLPLPPRHIQVEACAPQHAGLGTGTQLALAVARAVRSQSSDCPEALARLVGRGRRSAIGVHGFAQGGFLVEAGQKADGAISPLVARVEFPADWPILLIIPSWAQGLHGDTEARAIEDLKGQSMAVTETLCRLTLLGMLPALVERDEPAFGEALYDFNRRVGELFAPAQGGPYAHPRLEELVGFLRRQGVRGVGQSSWGPTVFAIAADADQAGFLIPKLRDRFGLTDRELLVTRACNQGARIIET